MLVIVLLTVFLFYLRLRFGHGRPLLAAALGVVVWAIANMRMRSVVGKKVGLIVNAVRVGKFPYHAAGVARGKYSARHIARHNGSRTYYASAPNIHATYLFLGKYGRCSAQ